ncbi:MAG: aldo/keto reductase [Clostridia bacterium]|nr:aldo/keto reductase [Clostridia bacterium]
MIYKNFLGKSLSALGMGCMRLPLIDGKHDNIDVDTVSQMVEYAINKGVNYFDTAWGYHDGQSERVIGKVLKKYPRESFYLASKFPGYDLNNITRVEEIFEEQLERCQVEYFDFYMFHNVCETNVDYYLDPKYGIFDYLIEQKKNGRIKHLGFSTHASQQNFLRFLDAYGEHMEFCQVQLNWIDWKMQNAKAKVEELNKRNIPVWVMEPVRGGKLATLEDKYLDQLKALRPISAVEWAFRYLQSIQGVTVTLSGMSNMAQLQDNIAIFEQEKPLNSEELAKLYDVANQITSVGTLPCTSCRYCTTDCPMELDIPKIIELYNEHVYTGGGFLAPMAIGAMPEEKRPSACIGCQQCESVCPQNIKISEMMTDFTSRLKD